MNAHRLAARVWLIVWGAFHIGSASAGDLEFDSFSMTWPDGFKEVNRSSKPPLKMVQLQNESGIGVTVSGPIPAPLDTSRREMAKASIESYAHSGLTKLAARHGEITYPLVEEELVSGSKLYILGCDSKTDQGSRFGLFFIDVSARGEIIQITVEGPGLVKDFVSDFKARIEASHWLEPGEETGKTSTQESKPVDTEAIRLLVRGLEYVNSAKALLAPLGTTLEARPLVDGLVTVVVLDTPKATRPLTGADLTELGLSQEQLFAIANQNMEKELGIPSKTLKPVGPHQVGTLRGYYQVGRVGIHTDWDQLAQQQGGVLLVALPTTDTVLYSSEMGAIPVDALRSLSLSVAAKSTNPLAPQLIMRWTQLGWEIVQ